VGEIKDIFANLCVTLSRTQTGTESSAYDYFIDTEALGTLNGGTEICCLNGDINEPRVIVTDRDFTIDQNTTDSKVHIVIASGDVTVNRAFTGLIFAGKSVVLYNSVTADRATVADALQALLYKKDAESPYAYRYLNPAHISPFNSTSDSSLIDVWDMNTLVTYENWKKNAA
jgi:hypothetical protein